MRIIESSLRQLIRENLAFGQPMSVIRCSYVPSPNVWGEKNLVHFRVDLGYLEHMPSAEIPGFADLLLSKIPTLRSHGCSYGKPGGFVRRLYEDEGTWMGHVMEHVAIELQCLWGHDVSFGRTRGAGATGVYDVWFECLEPRVGMNAGWDARDIVLRTIEECER